MAFFLKTINGNNLEQSVVSNTATLESNVHSMVFDETTGVDQTVEVRINGTKTVVYKVNGGTTTTIKDTLNVPYSTALSLVVPNGVNALINYVQIAVDPAAALTATQQAVIDAQSAVASGTINDSIVSSTDTWSSEKLSENQITLEMSASTFYITQSYEFKITNFDSLRTYTVTPTLGTTSIDPLVPDVIKYTAPATAGTESITINDKTITFPITGESILPPVILSPTQFETDVDDEFSIELGAFETVPASSDTHLNTSWQVATDPSFDVGSIVFESLADTVNLNTIFTTGTTSFNTDYYIRAKFAGNTLADSDWSLTTKVTTTELERSIIKIYTANSVANYYDEDTNILYVMSAGSTASTYINIIGIDLTTNTKVIDKQFTASFMPSCMNRDSDGRFYVGGLYTSTYYSAIMVISSDLSTVETIRRLEAQDANYYGGPTDIYFDDTYVYMNSNSNVTHRQHGIVRMNKITYIYKYLHNITNAVNTSSTSYPMRMIESEGQLISSVYSNASNGVGPALITYDKEGFYMQTSISTTTTNDYIIDMTIDKDGYSYLLCSDSSTEIVLLKMNSLLGIVESKLIRLSGTITSSIAPYYYTGAVSLSPDHSTIFISTVTDDGNTNGIFNEMAPLIIALNTSNLSPKNAVTISATSNTFAEMAPNATKSRKAYMLKALSNNTFVFVNSSGSGTYIWKGNINKDSASTLSVFDNYAEIDSTNITVNTFDQSGVSLNSSLPALAKASYGLSADTSSIAVGTNLATADGTTTITSEVY